MGYGAKFVRSLFIGFVFTPVFLVVFSALLFDLGIFIMYRGSPLTIHYIAKWVILSELESHNILAMFIVSMAWICAWLLVWSRCRELRVVIPAMFLSYMFYILYLVSFWGERIVLLFPESFTQLFLAFASCVIVDIVGKKRPKRTIFERLEAVGYRFPEHWKREVGLPVRCPKCGELLYSNAKYCWRCFSNIEG